MQVTLRLHGILRDYRPAGVKSDELHLQLTDDATLLHAVEQSGVPRKALHVAFVNDEQADLDAALKDGDYIRLFPPIVGGCTQRFTIYNLD